MGGRNLTFSMTCKLKSTAYPSIIYQLKYNIGLEVGLGYQNCQNQMEYGPIYYTILFWWDKLVARASVEKFSGEEGNEKTLKNSKRPKNSTI